jgi:putative transposase
MPGKLTAGASTGFGRIGAETIQRVDAQYAASRKQHKKAKLRWRVSFGSRRSLGWVPLKPAQLKRRDRRI